MRPNSKLVKCLYLQGAGFPYLWDKGVWRYLRMANTGWFSPFLFVCRKKNLIMPYLKLSLQSNAAPSMYKVTNPKQYELYEEILSFNGGMAFASADELIVKKKDGTVFRCDLSYYESDFLTETYLGHSSKGMPFRFFFASPSNPMGQIHPMVSFASLEKNIWVVHYDVHPL